MRLRLQNVEAMVDETGDVSDIQSLIHYCSLAYMLQG